MIGWNARLPTAEECEVVNRPPGACGAGTPITEGDYYVIETPRLPAAQVRLAEAFELFGMCDEAHVIPAGLYMGARALYFAV